jgi:hypothetical protein
MAKIIKLKPYQKLPTQHSVPQIPCEHKNVIAYRVSRTVRCVFCGAQLDPFDILVDMIQGHIPAGCENKEQQRFEREVGERQEKEPGDKE